MLDCYTLHRVSFVFHRIKISHIILLMLPPSRLLFTDKTNSIWHLVFGALTVQYVFIAPIFILYQLKDIRTDSNVGIDLFEYGCGVVIAGIIYTNTAS